MLDSFIKTVNLFVAAQALRVKPKTNSIVWFHHTAVLENQRRFNRKPNDLKKKF